MIGQSKKMVNPEVNIGVGLAGEQLHMVGIDNTKAKIGINNDPESPVFERVDYGIVEDFREFVSVLIQIIYRLAWILQKVKGVWK